MCGLPEDVMFRRGDQVRSVSSEDRGRALLPQVVLDQLLEPAALDRLEESFGADRRAMVELQARVGLRTGELCGLGFECLAFEEILGEAGESRAAPVLIHDIGSGTHPAAEAHVPALATHHDVGHRCIRRPSRRCPKQTPTTHAPSRRPAPTHPDKDC